MPELLTLHGRCPRCSQVLTVPAGQLQSVFRCARCQYRVLGSALLEEARLSPPRLASARPVVRPFDEDPDDQHTRLHLPATEADDEAETALPAQRVGGGPGSVPPPSVASPPLARFSSDDDPDDQQTRLHMAGSFDDPAPAPSPSARPAPRPPPKHATLLGVPAPARLSRFGAEAADPEDEATRFQLEGELLVGSGVESSRGQTARGMPAAPPSLQATSRGVPAAGSMSLSRFEQPGEDADDQHTRLQVPINYEEGAQGPAPRPSFVPPQVRPSFAPPQVRPSFAPPQAVARPSLAELRSPVAPRPSMPASEPEFLTPDERFGRATLQLSRVIDDWVRERHAVLLVTLAGLSAIIAPVFDVLLGNPRQGATVIAANISLFFLWALGLAWVGKVRNDNGVWDLRVAFTRAGTSTRLALADLASFGGLPQPLRWRVVAEVASWLGLGGLAVASALTLSHLVVAWPVGTGVLFLWRLFAGSCIVLAVIAGRESANVPVGMSPTPDVTAPAVAHFPAVLDLSLPLSVPPASAATALHQVLEVLSQWEPRAWPNQDSYLAVLERHFMRRMGGARIERDQPLSTERADGIAHLIVDDSLLVEVVHGFDAETAERVNARMRRHAKVWRGKPAFIVVFDASRAELLNGHGTPLLEALHHSYPMLAVRMPSALMHVA